MSTLEYRVTELERRVANLLRIGVVKELDPSGAQAAAQLGYAVSGGRVKVVMGEISTQGREILLSTDTPIEIPPPAWHLRRAGFLADLAWERLRAGKTDDVATLKAIYAR